jgi:hypothetical protein
VSALGTRAALAIGAAVVILAAGCKPKATEANCDQLLERYAHLVVTEKYPDASPADIDAEQRREKNEARGDDVLKNCSSEVSRAEFECAMRAATADTFEKCLE